MMSPLKFIQAAGAALLFFALGVSAVPTAERSSLHLSKKDVWAPTIYTPSSSTVWTVGQQVTATWDTTNPPQWVTNPVGQLLLGYLVNGNALNGLNLQDQPLASNFQLSAGQVTFTVPNVTPNNNYIVVLNGDSGNLSQQFTIQAAMTED